MPRRKRGSSGYAGAAAYDRIRSQVAGGRVRNVHGTAFALAVPGLLAQQFGEHLIRGSAFRQTMSMTAMRAGDVVGALERFRRQLRSPPHRCKDAPGQASTPA